MAGGIFTSQNKVRPGAYLNFKSVAAPTIKVGSRGIVTFATELSWGPENELIDVYSTDLTSGDSLKKIGLTAFDKESKLFNLALQNAYLAKVYRTNVNGSKAVLAFDTFKIMAKYTGEFGNKIAVVINRTPSDAFEVNIFANGYAVDTQVVKTAYELKDNDYVTFDLPEGAELEEITSTLLEGGTNGQPNDNSYVSYFNALKTAQFQTLAITEDREKINELAAKFIKELRDGEGKYVQVVLANYEDADYEGIINNVSSVIMSGEEISVSEFNAWIAGATAGASLVESNTGKVVIGATEIKNPLNNEEIIEALRYGRFVLSNTQDGKVKVEKDINSLHTLTADRSYSFTKNRVIRTLDEIGTSIEGIWENTYLGKVSNNDYGRTLFKSSIINYLTELNNLGAIQNFTADSVEVLPGMDVDTVVANIAIQPVDSMEILYMTVNVNG